MFSTEDNFLWIGLGALERELALHTLAPVLIVVSSIKIRFVIYTRAKTQVRLYCVGTRVLGLLRGLKYQVLRGLECRMLAVLFGIVPRE